MSKYIELYPTSPIEGSGLISQISENAFIPWFTFTPEQKQHLERNYFLRSGNKRVSKSFEIIAAGYRSALLVQMFVDKWTRLWDDFKLQYQTLSPYNITETGNNSSNKDIADVTTYGKTVTNNGTDTGTITTVTSGNSSDNQNIFGFNSTTAVGANSSTNNDSSNSTETRDLKDSNTQVASGEDVTESNTLEESEHTVTRTGNIGNTSFQELIKQDFDLWAMPYFEKVFADIDDYIMLKVYNLEDY